MTVLIGTTKGVLHDPAGHLYFDLVDLLDRFGMDDSLLNRTRLRAALITACREADIPVCIIERGPFVSRETEKLTA